MKKAFLFLLGLVITLGTFGFIYFKTRDANGQAQLKRSAFEFIHSRDDVAEKEAFIIGYNAYLYGFVRVKSILLQQKAIHPKYKDYAPINAFAISKELATPGFTDFTPNSDTFYGLAWLDVSQGPVLMTIPEISAKYWTIQATDASLNTFNYIGSRLKSKPGKFAYCKYDWKGSLPAEFQRIDCPTNQVFLQARNLVIPGDKADIKATYDLMMKYKLEALNKEAKYMTIDANSEIVNSLNSNPDFTNLNFYQKLNEALSYDPPVKADSNIVAQFAKLNIGPEMKFDQSKLSKSQIKGLENGQMAALHRIYDELKFGGQRMGGFNFRYDLGDYGANYALGSAVAFYGYGANTGAEAMYVNTIVDSKGDELVGKNDYAIHFNKDQIPPVNAFWSITMYSRPENQLIENEIDRYNIGGLTPGLKINQDGSIDNKISNKKPADTSNWLPAPKGDFWIIMRMYDPKEPIISKKYSAPLVTKL